MVGMAKDDKNKQLVGKLKASIQANNANEVKRLIAAGVNIKGGAYETLLFAAAVRGESEILKMLLSAGAKVENGWRTTTMLKTVIKRDHGEVLKILINAGADVNLGGWLGYTPLIDATYYGHADMVKMLLDAGADFTATTLFGISARSIAVKDKNKKIIALFDAVKT